MITQPQLVAHRGDRARFPENTLPALAGAVALGALYVEFDIQLTADGVPVLLHDPTLERTGGCAGDVREMSSAIAQTMQVGEARRFGERYAQVTVPALTEVVELLNRSPAVTAFVEIKRHSVERFGVGSVLKAVAEALAAARFPWVIISFVDAVVATAKADLGAPVGWVLRRYDAPSREEARRLAPEYLFVSAEDIPPGTDKLWPGPWRWVVYDVNDAALALAFAERGCGLVETDELGALMHHPALQRAGR
ncbi:MAG: glycerophosphodiester phosphodiesterase [Pseudomonadota bacterium]|nr:MAG: glycerophosphodiester phosphodiesterase [Pseudomonadota bacterium]